MNPRAGWILPVLFVACSAPAVPEPRRADEGPGPLPQLLERYETDREALRRVHSVPMSPRRGERLKKFLEDQQRELERVDVESLGVEGRVEAILFRQLLSHELRTLAHDAKKDADLASLLPFAETIIRLEESRRRMETIDPATAAERLTGLAKAVADARKGSDSAGRVAARRAAQRVFALRDTLRAWNRFYAGYHPEFTWWTQKPFEKADKELDGYGAHLRDKVAKENEPGAAGLVGDPIGRDALLEQLVHEMIPYTPEELIAQAEKEFAWCEDRMREASREMGCGDDAKKALEKVKSDHVPPGKQPDLVRDYALAAIKFVEDRDLVTVPELAKEVWRMEMMPPERQKVTPYFTGGEVVSVSFPTQDMDHDQKLMSLKGNNIHFCWATVQHELIPGHHLQGFMAARHRTHRRVFRTAFLVEGWALYWELLLWDLHFPRTPEDKVGMLFWRMHRAARIIVSLKFHLGTMTPVEMTDFLVDRVGHERDGATAEVRRYIGGDYPPLYQAAYLLGGYQIRALHQELVGSGRMTPRAFHDAVLRENMIPIEMIRADLTGERLPRDFSTRWRFLDGMK
jgi:uncharacterized protein DUF885